MIGIAIGKGFSAVRDALARGLVKLGVSPNVLTVFGAVCNLAAGACLALGSATSFSWTLNVRPLNDYHPSPYPLLAGVLLFLCAAGDMLDGAVARLTGKSTTFGAFLDSTLDRFSDFFIYLGIAFYFALRGNVTHTLLPFVCIFWATMISYTRARAEDLIRSCTVGYWQRGERMVGMLCASFACNVPALLWQQALLPLFTVLARIRYTYRSSSGQPFETDPRKTGRALDRLKWWAYPRKTWQYDVMSGIYIAFLIFAPIPASFDPIGKALGLN